MSDLRNILKEEYKKKEEAPVTPQSLIEMIEELYGAMGLEVTKVLSEARPGASGRRSRTIRLPPLVPTETTVGQTPDAEDAIIFRQWMKNIGESGAPGVDKGSVSAKIKAITEAFEKPEKFLTGRGIPETLSYLMFLDQFVYILTEFNASVGGFLWEPLLASLFGEGIQVHTREHDISDIRIAIPGAPQSPVSLKVLQEKALVGGSFTDLADHFKKYGDDPSTNMRYVVAIKLTGGKKGKKREEKEGEEATGEEGQTAAVQFYEFDLTLKDFFSWIGHQKFEHEIETKAQTFNFKDPAFKKYSWLKLDGPGAGADKYMPPGKVSNLGTEGNYLWIRTAGHDQHGNVKTQWLRLAKKNFGGAPEKDVWYVEPSTKEAAELAGELGPNGEFDVDGTYGATVAATKAGGTGGFKVKADYRVVGGSSTDELIKIWGGPDDPQGGYEKWFSLAQKALQEGRPSDFWNMVADVKTGPPGYRNKQKFEIKSQHYTAAGNDIGMLKVTPYIVNKAFKAGSENIGDDMTDMFNSMAALADNIGHFFLTDCGGSEGPEKKCDMKDKRNRNKAGRKAIENAQTLEGTVERSVGKLMGQKQK